MVKELYHSDQGGFVEANGHLLARLCPNVEPASRDGSPLRRRGSLTSIRNSTVGILGAYELELNS